MRSRFYILLALVFGLSTIVVARAETVGDRFHKGVYQEDTVGDLDAADSLLHRLDLGFVEIAEGSAAIANLAAVDPRRAVAAWSMTPPRSSCGPAPRRPATSL